MNRLNIAVPLLFAALTLAPTPVRAAATVGNPAPDFTLLAPDGKVGRLFGAKTTPHMFVINPKGTVVYAGAIDDHNSADADDIPDSKNYVRLALDQAMAGKPVATPSTPPYGCSIKYQ